MNHSMRHIIRRCFHYSDAYSILHLMDVFVHLHRDPKEVVDLGIVFVAVDELQKQ